MKSKFSAFDWALAAILLLALALRVLQLDMQPLFWDEGYSVFFATRDFPTMLARTAIDIHPPLYYALMQLWMLAFGSNVVTLRLLSVVIGVATIPFVFLVAEILFDRPTALVAAFLVALAPLHIYYSQEVRMYALLTLLAMASVWFQLKILTEDGGRTTEPLISNLQSPILYIVLTALGLYAEYYAAFFIAAEIAITLYLKFRARWNISLRRWVGMWLVVLVLYLPWVIYAGPKLYTYVTNKVGIEQYSRLDPLTYLVQHIAAFSTGHLTDWTWLAWGSVLFIALALVGFVGMNRLQLNKNISQSVDSFVLTAIYLFVPLLCGFLVNLVYPFHPIHYERLLLFAAPFFLILVARGIVALFQRQRALALAASAAVIVLCGLALYDFYTVPRYPDEDYRPLIQEMQTLAAPNDLVYAFYPWQIGYLATYYHGAPLNIYEVPSDTWTTQADAMDNDLARLRADNPRAWILAYQIQGRILESRVENEYINDYAIADDTFGNTRLEYFAQGNGTGSDIQEISFSPDLTLHVESANFQTTPHAPPLALARFTLNAKSDALNYSLRVTDASGSKLVQTDSAIPMGYNSIRRGLVLPPHLAPGEYTLRLVIYRRADGAPLSLPDGANDIALAKITIAQ